jgi:galactokinase
VLRDVKKADVLKHAFELRTKTGDRALLRAMHYYAENDRVDAMLAALKNADQNAGVPSARDEAIRTFLDLVAASGDSSWELLQNVFTTKLPSEQGVSLALALTREFLASPGSLAGAKGLKGISRVHGGGFAGTIQAYIPLGLVGAYIGWMRPVFGEKAVTVLRIRPIGSTELRP